MSKRKLKSRTLKNDSVNFAQGAAFSHCSEDELIDGINLLLNALKIRGADIRDWDKKNRSLAMIRKIGSKYYVLMEDTK